MDPRAENEYREFVTAQLHPMLRTAYLLCGHWHTAEDLVQTTFVQLYRAWTSIRSIDSARGYARRTLTNVYLSSRRRHWHGEQPFGDLPEVAGQDTSADVAERERQRQLLRDLPPRQRAVVVLRFWEDCSVDETARLMGVSPGTVKSTTATALAALRIAMEASHD